MTSKPMSADSFCLQAQAAALTLDPRESAKYIDLQVALHHNMRRKLKTIKEMEEHHAYRLGQGQKPAIPLSQCFDPDEGAEKTNLHYIFKAFKSMPPWELPREMLIQPAAVSFKMLDIGDQYFPCTPLSEMRHNLRALMNRILLPKPHAEMSEAERELDMAKYRADMDEFERSFHHLYTAVSIYFSGIEDPDSDPERKMIRETHATVKKIASRVCVKEPSSSFLAQEKAKEIWDIYNTTFPIL